MSEMSALWRLPEFRRGARDMSGISVGAAWGVVPEIVMTHGRLITTWQDARLYAVAVATMYFYSRRDILDAILTGTATMLALRLGLGW